jgi:hypothetical protein
MHQPNADHAEPKRRVEKKLYLMREELRRSAQRNRNAIEGMACVLGLLIGIVLGVILSREAPAGYIVEEGRAGTASLP